MGIDFGGGVNKSSGRGQVFIFFKKIHCTSHIQKVNFSDLVIYISQIFSFVFLLCLGPTFSLEGFKLTLN